MMNGYQPSRMFDLASDALSGAMILGIVACVAWLPPARKADIEILNVRPVAIGSAHLRDAAITGKLHWEPGGWIADNIRQ